MISIGLAPLGSASKKLEAREPWEGKRGRFSAKHMDSGQTCRGAGESSAYVPVRRTIDGTKGKLCLCSSTTDNKWYKGQSRTSAYNCDHQ